MRAFVFKGIHCLNAKETSDVSRLSREALPEESRARTPQRGESPSAGRLHFEDSSALKPLFGENDGNLKLIEKTLGVRIHTRGSDLSISGDRLHVELTEKLRQQEGFAEIADWFETLAKAEKSHAGRFQSFLDSIS